MGQALPILSLGAIGGGGLLSGGANRRNEGSVINNVNAADEYLNFIRQLGLGSFDPGRQSILDQLGSFDPSGFNPFQQQLNQFGMNALGQGNIFSPSMGGLPQTGQGLNASLGFGAGERGSVGMELLGNRGTNANLEFLNNRSQDLFAGARNDPRLNEAANVAFFGGGPEFQTREFGGGLLSGGRTAETARQLANFEGILNAGGQTAETRELFGQGQRLLNAGGFTPGLREIQNQANTIIQQGGLTPQAQQLFNELMPLIQSRGEGGALLPFQTAIAMARDEAATSSAQQAEGARRAAFNAGAAPGTVVGSGLGGQVLGEFADESARAEAAATREAARTQQALQLQQFLGASGIAGDISRAGIGLVASATGLLGNVASASAQNLATGANLGLGSQELANQRFGMGTQGFLGTLGEESNRFRNASELFLGTEQQRRQMEQTGASLGLGVQNQIGQNLGLGLGALEGITNQGLQFRGQNIQNNQFNAAQTFGLLQSLQQQGAQGARQAQELAALLFGGGQNILGMGPSIFGSRTGTITGLPAQPNPLGGALIDFGMGGLGGGQGFGKIFGGGVPGGGGIMTRIPVPAGTDRTPSFP